MPTLVESFTEHRNLLFGVAYRMLGSVAEAEDMVQDTFLRAQRQDSSSVGTPKAWLITTITRLCIDQLRSARRRREEYVGVWLPEPLVDATVPSPDAAADMSDSLSIAFLLMLEQLTPVERAVFLLREAFDMEYADIAGIVDKSEANCRQIVTRAKAHLGRRESTTALRPTARTEQIVQRFLAACVTGDVKELLAVLADDAVFYADGGGRVKAATAPIETAEQISQFLLKIREVAFVGADIALVRVNGDIGVRIRRRDHLIAVASFAFAGDRIRAIYNVLNPDKLQHVSGARIR